MNARSHRARSLVLALCLLTAGCPSDGGGGGAGGAVTFSKSYGGPNGDEAAVAISTLDGGFLMAGVRDVVRDGFLEGEELDGDAWITRLDRLGNTVWQRAFGERLLTAPGKETWYVNLAAEPAGGAWLVGSENRQGVQNQGSWASTGANLVVARVDALGQVAWRRSYDSGPFAGYMHWLPGGTTEEYGLDISSTADGGALVAAWLVALVDDGGRAQPANAVYVLKVDASGDPQWDVQLRRNEAQETPRGYFIEETTPGQHVHLRVRETHNGGAFVMASARDRAQIHHLGPGGTTLWVKTILGVFLWDGLAADDDSDGIPDEALLFVGTKWRDPYALKVDPFGVKIFEKTYDGWLFETVTQRAAFDSTGFPSIQYLVGGIGSSQDEESGGSVRILDEFGELLHETATANQVVEAHWRPATDRYQVLYAGPKRSNPREEELQVAEYDESLIFRGVFPPAPDYDGAADITPSGGIVHLRTDLVGNEAQIRYVHQRSDGTVVEQSLAASTERRTERAHAVVETDHGGAAALIRSVPLGGGGVPATVLVRMDELGETVWQRLLEDVSPVERMPVEEQPLPWETELFADVLVATSDGGFAVAGLADGHLRVIRLDADGYQLWNSVPLGPRLRSEADPLMTLRETSDGGFVVGGYGTGVWMARLDASGFEVWSHRFVSNPVATEIQLEEIYSFEETQDGGFVAAGRVSGFGDSRLGVMRLDAAGTIVWTRSYPLDGFVFSFPVGVAESPDGGIVLATTLAADASPAPGPPAVGGENALVLKLDADGGPVWYHVYGALHRERVRSLRGLPDGGLLVSGYSESLGDDREAWLLRLGYDGLLSPGCNAYLGGGTWPTLPEDIAMQHAAYVPNVPAVEMFPGAIAISSAALPVDRTPSPVTARQCLGTPAVYEEEPPPAGDTFVLTVEVRGLGEGIVKSSPAGIACRTTCSFAFPAGARVSLNALADPGSVFSHFLGCDGGAPGCYVDMTSDRTVEAWFE